MCVAHTATILLLVEMSDTRRAANHHLIMAQIERDKIMDWKKQYAKLVIALENGMYIFDNSGSFWYYDGEKIRLALADTEHPKDALENGYYCKNFEDGLSVLKDGGYL